MTRRVSLLVLVALLCAGAIFSYAQAISFEVASIKPSDPKSPRGVSGSCRGIDSKSDPGSVARPLGRCVVSDGRLNHILSIAYGLPLSQIRYAMARQPEWLEGRFDIEAKAEDPSSTTESQLKAMLQTLLTERFRLTLHRETQRADGYALVVARNGSKLRESTSERSVLTILGGSGPRGTLEEGKRNLATGAGPVAMTARRTSMAVLAENFAFAARGPVIDQTNLQGIYDFDLTWDESVGPSFFTALQEQLGLRLAPQKVPIDILVIDSAEKPTQN